MMDLTFDFRVVDGCVSGGQLVPRGGVSDETVGEPADRSHQGRPPEHEVGAAGKPK